jgi:DNA-binding transcriptional LysR family regulator
MDLDSARLRAFLHVAERGTIAAAAIALGYTAPGVSQQISKLETQLGAQLFDRIGGRLRLSPRGELLVPIARQILELTSKAEYPNHPRSRKQKVVLAGFASAIKTLVLPLLHAPVAKRVTFEIREQEDEIALRDLRLGDVDVAIIQEYDGAPIGRSERLTYTPLLRDRLRLIAPPTYPPSVRLAELGDYGWLVNGAGTRCEEATQQVLKAAGIVPRITGHISDNFTLLALVAAGHGETIAPELVIAGTSIDVTIARLDLGVTRTIFGVTRTAVADNYTEVLKRLAMTARASLPKRRNSGQ